MASTKECKSELRGHEHVVECVAWAPDTALPHVAEAVGLEVCVVYIVNTRFSILQSIYIFFLCE